MPSLRTLLSALPGLGMLTQTPITNNNNGKPDMRLAVQPNVRLTAPSLAQQCPIDGPLSCQDRGDGADKCCFITPGGQLVLTQFWDTHPSVGPEDSWTLHGLW
jgi:ribonuclease T2